MIPLVKTSNKQTGENYTSIKENLLLVLSSKKIPSFDYVLGIFLPTSTDLTSRNQSLKPSVMRVMLAMGVVSARRWWWRIMFMMVMAVLFLHGTHYNFVHTNVRPLFS